MGYIFIIIGFIIFCFHLFFTKQKRTKKYITEILLIYLFIFLWGIGGLSGFIGHVFFPEQVAASIGWKSETTFQFEVGIADLAFGTLAILCVFIRMKNFWLATIIANTIFYWGASIGHIRQMIVAHNFAPGNVGISFYFDVVSPIIFIVLFTWLMSLKKEKLI